MHPLFLLAGAVSAFTGQLLLFVSACLAAIEHECAHAFAARRFGYRLNKIVLMPYGAVIRGDLNGLSAKEELWVLAAGPLSNAVTALFFAGLWWIFPETYAYTDTAAIVSVSLFAVNLLPAYPLDGGRMLALFLRPLGRQKRRVILLAVTLTVAAVVLGHFAYTCFSVPNFSALAFGVMLAAGAWGGGEYSLLTFSRRKSFERGVEERRIALSARLPLRAALRFLRDDRYTVFVLYEGDTFAGELTETEFLSAFSVHGSEISLGDCLFGFTK